MNTRFGGLGSLLFCVLAGLFHPAEIIAQLSVTGISAKGSTVEVTFSEPVEAASATNASHYAITNSHGQSPVLSAGLASDGRVVRLNTTGQLPFMPHWLSVTGVVDALTGTNGIGSGSLLVYTNIGFTTGYVKNEVYRNIPGTTLPALTNNPAFPNSPSRVDYYQESFWFDSTIGPNYGNRFSGILVAPATGSYTFIVYGEGTTTLSLSTNEEPAFQRQVASCVSGNIAPSQAVPLIAGHKYYFEALGKEGPNANNYQYILWSPPGETNSWNVIPAKYMGNYISIPNTTVELTAQPSDQTVYENRRATFAVEATSNSRITSEPNYQWRLNGTEIPGATHSVYTTPLVYLTNSGSRYSVLAYAPGAAVMSREVLLTVTRDLDPPECVQALNFGPATVQLLFSEPIERSSALTMANYQFANGQPVLSVTLDSAHTTVTLNTPPLIYGSNYTVILNGIVDQALEPNTIAQNTMIQFVAAGTLPQDIGNPATASVITPAESGLDIVVASWDIGGTNDQFHFNYQAFAGDFDVKVRVAGLSPADPWAKAGIMAREDFRAGSRFAACLTTPSVNGVFFSYRDRLNRDVSNAGAFPANFPDTWLRLQRLGTNLAGFASYDGKIWSPLGGVGLTNLPPVIYLGFAASSRNTNAAALAQFRDLGTLDSTTAVIGRVENPREPLGPSSRKTPIVFSEIMYKPMDRTDDRNLEFIELYNSNPWFHDVGGYRIVAENLSYTIPAGTIIPGGGFLAVAAVPSDVAAVYEISGVLGPYRGSLKASGTLQLIDEQGAVLLTVPYDSVYPWPPAADGAGHSLVLANPSYGEEDPRAWGISNWKGGSPGQMESFTPDPLSGITINEILAHTTSPGMPDFIELYNHSKFTNDLSGCILTDDPARLKFIIPQGTLISPGGFLSYTQTELGFGVKTSGETVYLLNPNASRILDAVVSLPQLPGVSYGRWPNGAKELYSLSPPTPEAGNHSVRIGDVVINEIMYHTPGGADADQFIELHNHASTAVSLDGWELSDGISFSFPSNTTIAPGGYLVVAKNITNLFARYPNLTTANCVGNFSGRLSHNGERVALTRPVALNSGGTTYAVEDEVTFRAGGQWGQWSAGGGSSLELKDPRVNHRLAANWGDSDETAKSEWATITASGVLNHGSVYGSALTYAQLGLLDPGECLVDDIEVRAGTTGANLVKNPGFESGLANWLMFGCMTRSSLANGGYGGSTRALHVRSSSGFWTGVNSCQASLNPGLVVNQTGTLTLKGRWLKGSPEILLRVKGNWLEAVGVLPIPPNLGTPGARNSQFVSNAPPAIFGLTHHPPLPAVHEPALVTAVVQDPDGVKSLVLNYRYDYDTRLTAIPMVDNGTGGDAIAGDGIFSARIPAPGSQILVAFYLSAVDERGMTSRFPALVNDNAPVRECLVMFGDTEDSSASRSFGVYHLWLSRTNVNRWTSLPNLSNEMHDGTFVNGKRVIYNMQGRYVGSPYHQNYYSPEYSACHFKWVFPEDDKFLGATTYNKIAGPGNGAGDDQSLQREQAAYTFMRALGVPWLNRRYVALYVNGYRNLPLMEDTQRPGTDMVKQYFPDDSDGYLYKMQPWFEFGATPSGSYVDFNNVSWCTIMPYTTTGGTKKTARYRYTFQTRRTPDLMNNYTNVFSLIDAASSSGPNYTANMENIADMENWMRVFAANHAAGNWDSFGCNNAQNLYGYIGTRNTRYSLMMFDFNIVLGNSGSWGPGENLFSYNSADANLGKIYSNPKFRRMYFRALQELVDGPLDIAKSGPLLDAKYDAFVANGLSVERTTAIKSWLTSARRSIGLQIASATNAAFAVTPNFVATNSTATLNGTAPVRIHRILFNGVEWPVTWLGVNVWTANMPLQAGTNVITATGIDRNGQLVPGAATTFTIVNPELPVEPFGHVVVSEVMFNPAIPGAQFIELYNADGNATFDLSGWQIREAGYTFPSGSVLGPNKYLVLAQNRTTFAAGYGAAVPVFDVFTQPLSLSGGTVTLELPEAGGAGRVVAQMMYGSDPLWPSTAHGPGSSLQLIDPTRDNWRPANWSATRVPQPASPGAANPLRADLPAFPTLWLNEIQPENLTGITNRAGARAPWFELFNPSETPVSLDGLYLGNSFDELSGWGFPTGLVVNPGEFKLVFADGRQDLSDATELHSATTLAPGSGVLALFYLDENSRPQVLDYIAYTNVSPDRSYGSIPDGQSFARQHLLLPTPGTTNNPSGVALTLVINEWMASNTRTIGDPVTGKFEDWFELYNYGDQPVDLSGCYLTDRLSNQLRYQVPAGYSVPARGFLLVWADDVITNGTPDLHVNFKLSKEGSIIALSSPDGRLVDYVSFGLQASDVAMGRYPNGAPGIYILPGATPRSGNVSPNHPPTLLPIGAQFLTFGQSLQLTARGVDDDQPPQLLSYSLGLETPPDAVIDPATGTLSWTPTKAPSTNWIRVVVSDNGMPPLSTSELIMVTTVPAPAISGMNIGGDRFTLSWLGAPRHRYQVEYKEDLSSTAWEPLASPINGEGAWVTITNNVEAAKNRFFRLRLVP